MWNTELTQAFCIFKWYGNIKSLKCLFSPKFQQYEAVCAMFGLYLGFALHEAQMIVDPTSFYAPFIPVKLNDPLV